MYTFYSSPGHAWLSVPVKQLIELGIADKITPYSFISPGKRVAYLEEDCDASTFLTAVGSANVPALCITERHTDFSATCESYDCYNPDNYKGAPCT